MIEVETTAAVAALGALAQETRLEVFRLLVRQGPAGLPAGRLAEALGVPGATLSFHLKELHRAGLVACERAGRRRVYRPDFAAVRELLAFLAENCCRGDVAGAGAPGAAVPGVTRACGPDGG